ncbi:unnamed protein product [Protopolystoma xenopodis]|uniref:Uncharacterized protein n=1 Tax=Protopolystoma xenopodis TaxID=117903 RepID=A0A448WKT9_9PLAT|nr:unnamed protein product [Protopolystoma xenopodis]
MSHQRLSRSPHFGWPLSRLSSLVACCLDDLNRLAPCPQPTTGLTESWLKYRFAHPYSSSSSPIPKVSKWRTAPFARTVSSHSFRINCNDRRPYYADVD